MQSLYADDLNEYAVSEMDSKTAVIQCAGKRASWLLPIRTLLWRLHAATFRGIYYHCLKVAEL